MVAMANEGDAGEAAAEAQRAPGGTGPSDWHAANPALTHHVDEIRRRAYARFLAREGAPGSAVDDWLAAEREVRGTPEHALADVATTAQRGGVSALDAEAPRGTEANGPSNASKARGGASKRRRATGTEDGGPGSARDTG